MDDDRRSPIDDLAAMFPGLDTASASRMVAEVQRLGLDTAKMVIDRFSGLAGQWPSAGGSDGRGSQGATATSSAAAPGPLQADAERAVDAYLNVVRRLFDVVAGFAATAVRNSREPRSGTSPAPAGVTRWHDQRVRLAPQHHPGHRHRADPARRRPARPPRPSDPG